MILSGFGRSAFVFGQSQPPIYCITYSFSTNIFLAYFFIVLVITLKYYHYVETLSILFDCSSRSGYGAVIKKSMR